MPCVMCWTGHAVNWSLLAIMAYAAVEALKNV